jgi:hypothetical protein
VRTRLGNASKRAFDSRKVDHRPVAIHRGQLEHVSKLANVARPGIPMQAFERLRVEAPLAHFGLHLAKEVLRQERDVVRPDA